MKLRSSVVRGCGVEPRHETPDSMAMHLRYAPPGNSRFGK
jgi:hypothetical protein